MESTMLEQQTTRNSMTQRGVIYVTKMKRNLTLDAFQYKLNYWYQLKIFDALNS